MYWVYLHSNSSNGESKFWSEIASRLVAFQAKAQAIHYDQRPIHDKIHDKKHDKIYDKIEESTKYLLHGDLLGYGRIRKDYIHSKYLYTIYFFTTGIHGLV